jgi:CheY-like chemotaxis protein
MAVFSIDERRNRYQIRCFHCSEKFDAVSAQWCDCLARTPTLICPACQACFCSAPHSFKLDFWAGAPADFVKRNPYSREAETAPSEVLRPLVLVVDDVASMRLLASAMLRRLGYGVAVAADGQEGLAVARELRPDLVLTDALMPKLDGREMCRLIKATPGLGETKIVVMSAVYTAQRYQHEAVVRYGADDFLTKPFDARLLRDVLGELVGPPATSEEPENAAFAL